MLPLNTPLYALSSFSPGTSLVMQVVGWDDVHLWPFVIWLEGTPTKPVRWDEFAVERCGKLVYYPTYEAACDAKDKAKLKLNAQTRELLVEVEQSLKEASA